MQNSTDVNLIDYNGFKVDAAYQPSTKVLSFDLLVATSILGKPTSVLPAIQNSFVSVFNHMQSDDAIMPSVIPNRFVTLKLFASLF